jgi:hypothetical protein
METDPREAAMVDHTTAFKEVKKKHMDYVPKIDENHFCFVKEILYDCKVCGAQLGPLLSLPCALGSLRAVY